MKTAGCITAISSQAYVFRAMQCVVLALCFLAPVALADFSPLCKIQGDVSLAWEGFEDGVSHPDLGTAGQNNDYWRLEVDRIANTTMLQRSACSVSLLLTDVPYYNLRRGSAWLAVLELMYPGADGGTQVHNAPGRPETNFNCEVTYAGAYCTDIVIAGPFTGSGSGCDERHTYARNVSSGCRGVDMPAFGPGEYYAFVSTFDSQASVDSDVRRIPGTFVIGKPVPTSGVGDGGNSDDDHGDTPDTATVVTENSTTQGDLENVGDEDVFRIEISQSGRLAVGTTGHTDTVGTLSGPMGEIDEDDDDGDGTNFLIVTNVQAGRHHVLVRGYGAGGANATGPYTLVVEYLSQDGSTATYRLPLVTAARNTSRQGFVRVINGSDRAGSVQIHAIDDSGQSYGPIMLSIGPSATRHFNAGDLEDGNPDKGLSGGVGSGSGDWRLDLTTDLDILPLAYVRTRDGLLAAVHDLVPESGGTHYVPTFNPASNDGQSSLLRLVNLDDRGVDVMIDGLDDGGEGTPMGQVSLQLPAHGAMTVSANDLEGGSADLQGRLGDGRGKWQLFVTASGEIQVLSLMETVSGHLLNLSTSGEAAAPPSAPGSGFQALERLRLKRHTPSVDDTTLRTNKAEQISPP